MVRHYRWSRFILLFTELLLGAITGTPIQPPARETTITGAFMRSSEAHYYLTGFTSVSFRNISSHKHRIFYNSSVSKYLFSSPAPRWTVYLPLPTTRLLAVTANARGDAVFIAGVSYNVDISGRHYQHLFVAKLTILQGQPKLDNNFTSSPLETVSIRKIITEDSFVYLCGQTGTPWNSSQVAYSSAQFVHVFDKHLNLLRTVRPKNGTALDSCVDALVDTSNLYVASTRYHVNSSLLSRPHNGVIESFRADGSERIWSAVVSASAIRAAVNYTKVGTMHVSQERVPNVDLLNLALAEQSLFATVQLSHGIARTDSHVAILKVSARTGTILWAVTRPIARSGRTVELAGATGLAATSDNALYAALRVREQPSGSSGQPLHFVTYVMRIGLWGAFDPTHDLSTPLWPSADIDGPARGVIYSSLQDTVVALGVRMHSNETVGPANTYFELPLGPVTRTVPALRSVQLGASGPQFLRMTFILVVRKGAVAVAAAADVLGDLLHVTPSQLQPTNGLINIGMDVSSESFSLFVRGKDLDKLEASVRLSFATSTATDASDGRNAIERRFDAPAKSIGVKRDSLVVRSRGRTVAMPGTREGRTAADVAEDWVRKTTIIGVGIAASLVVAVLLAVVVGKVRGRLQQSDSSDGSFNENTIVETITIS